MTFGIMSWSLVAAAALALLFGGDFRHLSSVKFRGWWLFALAFALKFGLLAAHAPASHWAQPLIFALVAAGAAANWRMPGVAAITFGLLLNVVVVAANGGAMPFSATAWTAAGKSPLALSASPDTLSMPQDATTRLSWLDDRIPFPPTKQVLSVGDVFIMLGGVWLIVGISRPQRLPAVLGLH